jgi:FkbM family methyltransferase
MSQSIDVVIPVQNPPSVFAQCLESIYREIPINRLIVGLGRNPPWVNQILANHDNVVVVEQGSTKTLGSLLQQLFMTVGTEWFAYLHSDVFLPQNWFKRMKIHQDEFDFFECRRIGTPLSPDVTTAQSEFDNQFSSYRAYSGSQVARRDALQSIRRIEDDYVNRTEDIVFQQLVEEKGFRYGKVSSTYHIHHIAQRKPTSDEVQDSLCALTKYLSSTNEYNLMAAREMIRALRATGSWNEEGWLDWLKRNSTKLWRDRLYKVEANSPLGVFTRLGNYRRRQRLLMSNYFPFSSRLDKALFDVASLLAVITRTIPSRHYLGLREFCFLHDLVHLRRMVKLDGDGYTIRAPCRPYDIEIASNQYESALRHAFLMNEGDIAIDVGSHIGTHTLMFAKMVGKTGRVVSVEPNPDAYRILVSNIADNQFTGTVTPIQKAISNYDGIISLKVGDDPRVTSGDLAVHDREDLPSTINLPCTSIDSLVQHDSRLSHIEWIKVDVEGMEEQVVQGMADTINKFFPTLHIEIHRSEYGQRIGVELRGRGYHCFPMLSDSNGHYRMLALHP